MSIDVTVSGLNTELDVTIGASTEAIKADIGEFTIIEPEPYKGSYDVTPTRSVQSLDTDNKMMVRDVTIQPIPYYETSNPKGITAIIGG